MELEELRLQDQRLCPAWIAGFTVELEQGLIGVSLRHPTTIGRAHERILDALAYLTGDSQPAIRHTSCRLKLLPWLTIPPRGFCGLPYGELVEATVDRAYERWILYARMARQEPSLDAWRLCEAAWDNYYWLLERTDAKPVKAAA